MNCNLSGTTLSELRDSYKRGAIGIRITFVIRLRQNKARTYLDNPTRGPQPEEGKGVGMMDNFLRENPWNDDRFREIRSGLHFSESGFLTNTAGFCYLFFLSFFLFFSFFGPVSVKPGP